MGQKTNTSPPNSTLHFRGPAAGRARRAPNDGIDSLAASVRHYTTAEKPRCRALSSLATYQSAAASKSAAESWGCLIHCLPLPGYRFIPLDEFLILLFLHWCVIIQILAPTQVSWEFPMVININELWLSLFGSYEASGVILIITAICLAFGFTFHSG